MHSNVQAYRPAVWSGCYAWQNQVRTTWREKYWPQDCRGQGTSCNSPPQTRDDRCRSEGPSARGTEGSTGAGRPRPESRCNSRPQIAGPKSAVNPEKTTYHQKSIPHIVALDSWQRASSRCDGPIGSAIYYGRLFGYLKGERLSGGMINQTTSSGVKMDKLNRPGN